MFPDTTVKPEASRSDPLSWLKWNHSFCELVPLLPEEALSRGTVMTWPGHWSAGSFQIMTVMALEFFGPFTNPKLVLVNSGLNLSPLAQQSHSRQGSLGASGAMWVKIALELISCRALCSEDCLMLFAVLASRSPDNSTPCKPPSLCDCSEWSGISCTAQDSWERRLSEQPRFIQNRTLEQTAQEWCYLKSDEREPLSPPPPLKCQRSIRMLSCPRTQS